METGTKVAIGAVVAAGVGFGIYWFFIRETGEIVAATKPDGTGAPEPSGGSSSDPAKDPTKIQKAMAEAKRKLKDVQCNLKFPPPRTKAAKKKAYRDCLHSCDATMHNAAGTWG